MLKTLNLKVLAAGSVIALTSIVASCKKDVVRAPGSDNAPSKLKTQSAGDNKYDLLGFGYDVTGEYASSNSSTFRIIDMDKLVHDVPDLYTTDVNVNTTFEYFAGGNAEDYSKNLATSVTLTNGVGPLFKSTFTASFHENSTVSSKYSYASASELIRQKRLRFSAPSALLRSTYLTAQFTADVNSMTAQQLVAKYGTHVLTDIILGAKLSVYYRSENNSSNKTIGVKAGMNYNALFKSFNLSADMDYSTTDINSNYNQSMYYATVGGDGTKGLIAGPISLDNTSPKVDVSNWQSSCTRDNAAFIQFGSKDSLIPLYDLISDAGKQQAVKDYITQYLTSNQVTVIQEPVQGSGLPADWVSRAKLISTPMPADAIHTGALPILVSNGTNTLYSQNHVYKLVLQGDGNLVLYNSGGVGLWNSKTNSTATGWTYKLYYAADGNLILKKVTSAGNEQDIWASYTEARGGTAGLENARRAYMLVQNDGNVALYYNGLDGGQYSLEYSTGTDGGRRSQRAGSFK